MTTIGKLMMVGIEGTKVSSEHRLFLKETGIGGVILFARNYESPKQLERFIMDLKDASETPLIVAVDQEGGRVARLKEPFTKVPPMAAIGAMGEDGIDAACAVGKLIGRELSAVGINLDFAPVLDVATNPVNPVIGDRAFSTETDAVARIGSAFISGMQAEGVAACAKHFPGHGDTDVDSHLGLPMLAHTRPRLDACELVPFRAAIETGVASMMTAHLMLPNIDRDAPASISRPITTEMLRRELGFKGLIFTDDLTMKALANSHPPSEWAWRAISAGADMALICHDRESQRAALDGLRRALGEGWIAMREIAASLERIDRFVDRYCADCDDRPSLKSIGCREHLKIVKRLG